MAEKIGLTAVLEMGGWNRATKQYQGDLRTMTGQTSSAAGSMSGFLSGIGSAALGMAKIVSAAMLGLGVGIAGAITAGTVKAIDLDQQLADIAATAGLTKDQVAPLKGLISDLALDPRLKVTAGEAAEAIQILSQNGLGIEEILNGAALGTTALANATGGTFATSAQIATDAMAIFGVAGSDLETVADGVTGVLNKSKLKSEDYALALAAAGGVAAGTGVSLDDFNTVLVASASSFSSGADAGTSFKTFLQRLANPTDEAAGLMADLGISVFDANGKMKPMSSIVGDLNKSFAGMSDAQRASTAAVLGGADAGRTFLSLAGLTEEQFINLNREVNASGQAMKAASTRMDTTRGRLDILGGIVEAAGLAIGDKFLPAVDTMLSILTDLATEAAPGVIEFFGNIAGYIERGIPQIQSALTGAAGLLAMAWEGNWTGLGVIAQQALAAAWSVIQTELAGWTAQFMDWLIAIYPTIPARLTGLVNAITTAIATNWPIIEGSLREWGNKFWGWVDSTAIPALATTMGALAAALAAWASSSEAQTALTTLGQTISTSLLSALGLGLRNQEQANSAMGNLAVSLAGSVASIAGSLIVVGGQIVAGLWAGVAQAFGVNIKPWTFNQLKEWYTWFYSVDWKMVGSGLLGLIGEGLNSAAGSIVAKISEIGWQIHDGFVEAWQGIYDTLIGNSLVWDMIADIVSAFAGLPGKVAGVLGGGLISAVMGGGDTAAAAPAFDPTAILTSIQTVTDAVTVLQTVTLPAVTAAFVTSMGVITALFPALVSTGITPADLALQNIYTLTLPALESTATTVMQNIALAIGVITGSTLPALVTAIGTAGTAFTTLDTTAGKAMDNIVGYIDDVESRLGDLADFIKADVVDAFNKMRDAAKEASDASKGAGDTAKAKTGVGFSKGLGFAGGLGLGWTVPGGYPNDSFPMRVESGEQVLITPRGLSIDELISSRMMTQAPIITTNYNFEMTVNTGASPTAVIQQFEVMRALVS